MTDLKKGFKSWIGENKVVVLFVLLCIGAIYASGNPLTFVAAELFTRIGRNGFTVLSLLIPVLAGMGLNFGIVIGAIAAQIGVFWVVYWGFTGIEGFLLCVLMATPLAIFFGFLVGKLFNLMKGAEMIAGMVLGYFADGLYQLFFLYVIGGIIPMGTSNLIIPGGVGVKNTVDLAPNIKYSLDTVSMLSALEIAFYIVAAVAVGKIIYRLVKKGDGISGSQKKDLITLGAAVAVYALSYIPFVERFLSTDRLGLLDAATGLALLSVAWNIYKIVRYRFVQKQAGFDIRKPILLLVLTAVLYALTYIPEIERVFLAVNIPVTTYLCIVGVCIFNNMLLRTRLGQNMRTVGHSRTVANAAGINVDRTRVIAMVLSTMLACWGQLIYLQNIGTFSTYGAHTQVGQFAIAALLVGGASVQKATNKQAIIGVILFHTLFIVAPQAGKQLFNNAQLGEYFRVFVAYGVIAVALAMHAWKKVVKPKDDPASPATAVRPPDPLLK